MPVPGIWNRLGLIHKRSFLLAILMGILAKGRGRLFVVGAALADVFVSMMLFVLENGLTEFKARVGQRCIWLNGFNCDAMA